MFDDKVILITGGTGSFGRSFIASLLKSYSPRKIIVYSRDEYKQFLMAQEFNSPVMRYFIGDVRDYERLDMAMRNVDFVAHAAALKHVPIAEYNPMECIKTNIHGAENIIRASLNNEVKMVIALSTDKAVNPINLYGATKLASDKLFIAANNMKGSHPCKFSVVRYGNVVGSRGSIVPYFEKLISQGARTLPITDVRMTRFWISLDQGIEFVMKSFQRMQGGETFVPKIPSVRIVDIADAMLPGCEKNIVGTRPGEKLHEVMCPLDSASGTYSFHDHYVIKPEIQLANIFDFSTNLLGEVGVNVPLNFEYHSGNNPHFLSMEEIKMLNDRVALI